MPEKVSVDFVRLLISSEYDGVFALDDPSMFHKGGYEISRIEDARCNTPAWLDLMEDRWSVVVTGICKIDRSRRPIAFVKDIRGYEHFRFGLSPAE